MKIDATDIRILEALQENGRMTISELCERAGLSSSPAHRRQKLLEEAGIIDRYVAVVDPSKVGLPMQVYVFLSFGEHSEAFLSEIEKTLMRCPQVLECILLAGAEDFMIHTICRDLEDFEDFMRTRIRNLKGVTKIRTSFRLRSVGNGRRVRFS